MSATCSSGPATGQRCPCRWFARKTGGTYFAATDADGDHVGLTRADGGLPPAARVGDVGAGAGARHDDPVDLQRGASLWRSTEAERPLEADVDMTIVAPSDGVLRQLLAAWAYRYSSMVCLQGEDAILLEVEGSLGATSTGAGT